ncbi:TRAP transporter fused permease subunit [Ehrlichia ruminantium]|uniref:TRAP transporter fused permease subunit n=1 Tax=Ehrlichia ruminantium TaxID=779 RepID=A0AAE6QBS0_EHRRU|nr:TRAP transporter fused permease subunit [Ehrlichia ruminantium]QGR02746.1 TRAP transporter fused permease subunit [Ehrlichia ruminantium]QGR03666.1 TRAP transporter fused permease subunit [Ehrlichia ruminantium]QGR04593.1 TRAP transporter fused permease subunit [Ehrlichia ruminantium]
MKNKEEHIQHIIDRELASSRQIDDCGKITSCTVSFLAFFWACFQLFIASPLPFCLVNYGIEWAVLPDIQCRAIHLAFAFSLLFLFFPVLENSNRTSIKALNWISALLASISALYIVVFYEELSFRIAMPNDVDLVIAFFGLLFLLEGARRAIGLPITIIILTFLTYAYFGKYMPDIIAHKGHNFSAIASHEWLSSEGVFGVALSVSSNFVFLYVLFGAFLDKAGAGNFFIKLSFALLGRFVGGPAKAAVIASGFMGMMSGSSIANTITIGSFTIPLMKKMGLSAEKAAAIEVSAGVNGQIMPPVMGAAAFLMSEFLSIPYATIVKYAFVPAVMVYVTLLYIVHLEACKLDMRPVIDLTRARSIYLSLLRFFISASCIVILSCVIYVLIEGIHIYELYIPGIKAIFLDKSLYCISLILVTLYVGVLFYQSKGEHLRINNDQEDRCPNLSETFKYGIHYFIPIFILIWCLIVEKMSSALSCFWTNLFLIFMLLTRDTIYTIFTKRAANILSVFSNSIRQTYEAMIMASKNMISIAIATGAAGIIVGIVSLTGFGLSISGVLDSIASGSLFFTLLVTAIICIVLGMGMPATGCYIIVSTLMAPILSSVIHKSGIYVPQIAIHLFVFYFGIMADVTPPVGIASYAAAAIAKGNAFKTGVQSFLYNVRTMIVPFLFIYNTELILYDITNIWDTIIVICVSLVGILSISAAMQGYFIRRNKFYESIMLLVVGVLFIMQNYITNLIVSPYNDIMFSELERTLVVSKNSSVKMTVQRKDDSNNVTRKDVIIPLKDKIDIAEYQGTILDLLRKNLGIIVDTTQISNNKLGIVDIASWSYVEPSDMDNTYDIVGLALSYKKYYYTICIYLIAIILLLIIIFLQTRRSNSVK